MKLQKNKIVFVLVVVSVVLFMTVYSLWTFGEDEPSALEPNQIPLPELEGNTMEYESKLEALDALKEERKVTAPPLYPEHMVDEKGYFNPDYMEYEKQRIIDSIYRSRNYGEAYSKVPQMEVPVDNAKESGEDIDGAVVLEDPVATQEMALQQQLFFASNPVVEPEINGRTDTLVRVRVDGTQTVRQHTRLRMRLMEDAVVHGSRLSKNTPFYGFVSFKPNRAIITIDRMAHKPIDVVAYDLQDGNEGIYVMNTFRAEATREITADAIGGINIGGMPQVRGIKSLLQRDNRNVKVTLMDNYQLVLKLPKGH
ncbi:MULTISPECIES: conjugative transposon protein TraM [unclassified Allomuricauda]|jgi:hypothetical protein|uniref:conjugative transposon protein TraM n=1 Tax=unclassified Allomuricauda TaxID=2615049 RepID=UPI001B0C70B2|nr:MULTISPECIES: conjugative transposon protein TraM [unclassified Allomuricauda]MBO6830442.1 conjugative transposon protein TraM [Allomuricauda sp.]